MTTSQTTLSGAQARAMVSIRDARLVTAAGHPGGKATCHMPSGGVVKIEARTLRALVRRDLIEFVRTRITQLDEWKEKIS